mmetsp:Transcript_14553/g.61345  ORF Transcript_14553/g.61345 Transcript_14553/m.61345 type:complete len:290 (+) Transcript_14553:139-1008(+)
MVVGTLVARLDGAAPRRAHRRSSGRRLSCSSRRPSSGCSRWISRLGTRWTRACATWSSPRRTRRPAPPRARCPTCFQKSICASSRSPPRGWRRRLARSARDRTRLGRGWASRGPPCASPESRWISRRTCSVASGRNSALRPSRSQADTRARRACCRARFCGSCSIPSWRRNRRRAGSPLRPNPNPGLYPRRKPCRPLPSGVSVSARTQTRKRGRSSGSSQPRSRRAGAWRGTGTGCRTRWAAPRWAWSFSRRRSWRSTPSRREKKRRGRKRSLPRDRFRAFALHRGSVV